MKCAVDGVAACMRNEMLPRYRQKKRIILMILRIHIPHDEIARTALNTTSDSALTKALAAGPGLFLSVQCVIPVKPGSFYNLVTVP